MTTKQSRIKAFISILLITVFVVTGAQKTLALPESADGGEILLYPGGVPFGVKLMTDGLIVVGFSEVDGDGGARNPAYDAGLRENDVILKFNGSDVKSTQQFVDAIESANGAGFDLTYRRNDKEFTVTVTPVKSVSDGRYKTGMWVRDSTAGIGTVTYIVPGSGEFAGLGHGICDIDTGELLPLAHGVVVDVSITGIVKGVAGTPGEIRGTLSGDRTGALLGNTKSGVFGILDPIPEAKLPSGAIPCAKKDEIKEGEAFIYCTLDDNTAHQYSVSLSDIRTDSSDNKCFVVTVTDTALLEKTGGIVQGMSGSPIIQNGHLVGAVTHVLINDPQSGYGIFIENMLNVMSELPD